MSRKRIGPETGTAAAKDELARRLADELSGHRAFGQPFIFEQVYQTGKIKAVVVWDEWNGMPWEERTATILRAYETAEGREYRDRLVLVSGLTVPEAHASGMLPYKMIPALRKSDPVTFEQAWEAFLEEGGSRLANPREVDLRFATDEDARAARERLIRKFPGTEDVWLIQHEVEAQDLFQGQDDVQVVKR